MTPDEFKKQIEDKTGVLIDCNLNSGRPDGMIVYDFTYEINGNSCGFAIRKSQFKDTELLNKTIPNIIREIENLK